MNHPAPDRTSIPSTPRDMLLRPTAWSILMFSGVAVAVMIIFGIIGAPITLAGGTIMFMRDPLSVAFMTVFIGSAMCAGLSMIGWGIQSFREAQRGYTT